MENMNEDVSTKKEEIRAKYIEITKEKCRLPTYADFLDWNITRDMIKHHFGNLTKLHDVIEAEHSDILAANIAHESIVFSKKKIEQLKGDLKNYKRFVVTTAVTGKKVFEPFYRTLKSYCEQNDALLLLLPSADIASTSTVIKKWVFDPLLIEDFFVHEEVQLNSKLFISNIKISAKQIDPTTGLSRIGQRNGSYIFASPKQFLEFVATSPSKEKNSMALMTPGAVTVPDYSNQRYLSDRTSYIAESDHVLGAIVVEIENEKMFHFRQIQSNSKGEFIDLANRYRPDGTVSKEDAHFVAGDWHSGQTDETVLKGLDKFLSEVNVRDFFVGDFFDGYSISHHHIDVPLKRVKKIKEGKHSLSNELYRGSMDINWILERVEGSLVMIKGNHDEVLEKYLMNANYIRDDNNHYDSLELAKFYLEGKNVLKEAYDIHGEIHEPERIIWLERDEEFKIAQVECGQHGDKGSNGSKGSLLSIEKAYGNCIVGHTHSAAILRGVYRVGTFTELKLEYVTGPSSWTHTGCLIYDDGSRQLINFVNGEYKIYD